MNQILTKSFLLKAFILSVIYLIIIIYLMNLSLVLNTILGNYPLPYKMNLLLALLEGMWTTMTHITLFILIINSFLTGAILVLIGQKITQLRKMKGTGLIAGGSSLFTIAGAGCTACGLPILSLVGLGGAVLYLPFKGKELPYLSMLLLSVSLYLLIRTIRQSCEVKVSLTKNKI